MNVEILKDNFDEVSLDLPIENHRSISNNRSKCEHASFLDSGNVVKIYCNKNICCQNLLKCTGVFSILM